MKSTKNMPVKRTQMLTVKEISEGYPQKPIKINNIRSAKRLLSRLIFELQQGTITSQLAKDITYLLVSYVNIFKSYEIEKRLDELEKRIK